MDQVIETRREIDGQTIYVLGYILGATYQDYMSQYNSDAWTSEWSYEKHQHVALRKFVRFQHSEMAEWLREQQALVTYWINPESMFRNKLDYKHTVFEYGVGFRPSDPVESLFVLKWS